VPVMASGEVGACSLLACQAC